MRRLVAWFALLSVLLFSPYWLGGRVFLPGDFLACTSVFYNPDRAIHNFDLFDPIIYYYPQQAFLCEELAQGRLATWNPRYLLGVPVLANGQNGYLYPPRLLLSALFPPLEAYHFSLWLHVLGAGCLMALYCRRALLWSEAGAAMAGTVWMLNGYVMTWLENDNVTSVAALVPLGLLAAESCRSGRRGVAAMGVVVALLIASGHLQFVLYGLGMVALAGGFRLRHSRAGLARALAGGLLGLCLSAPVWYPTMVAMQGSQRPPLESERVRQAYREFLVSSPPTLLYPEFWGGPVSGFAWTRITSGGTFIFSELCIYLGVVPLLLCLGHRRLWLPGLALLVLPATPLYDLLRWCVPGLARLNATRGIFGLLFLGALGAGWALQRPLPRRVGALALGLALAGLLAAGWWSSRTTLDARVVRLPDHELYADSRAYQQSIWQHYLATYSPWGAPFGLQALWLGLAGVAWWRGASPRVLVLLTALDLTVFALRYNTTVPRDWIYPANQSTRVLSTASTERVLGVGTVKPNTLTPYGILDVGGFDSFYPKATAEVMACLMFGGIPKDRRLPVHAFPLTRVDSPWVDLLGVRFVVTVPGVDLPGRPVVAETPLWVHENPSRLPRAWVVGRLQVEEHARVMELLQGGQVDPRQVALLEADPGLGPLGGQGSARILAYQPAAVELACESSGPALLMLSDAWSPGWRATVEGHPAPVLLADGALRAVPVPAGRSRVSLAYTPPGWPGCWWACGFGLLVAGGLALSGRKEAS